MDVNGHSFVSIVHQEAVHILRSYKNLILTIKVTRLISCMWSVSISYPILCRVLEEYRSLHLKPMYPRPLFPKVTGHKLYNHFSLGVIAAVGTEAHPSSPHSRKRTSSLLKSLKSKLSTHSEEEEEEDEEEKEEKKSHTLVREETHETRPRSNLQRSHSMKASSLDRRRFASSNNAADRLDLARNTSEPHQYISNSAGIQLVIRGGRVTSPH